MFSSSSDRSTVGQGGPSPPPPQIKKRKKLVYLCNLKCLDIDPQRKK